MQVGGVLNVGDFVPALRWLDPQGVVAKMKKLHRRFDDMMNGIIAERKAGVTPDGEEGKDLLGLLLPMVHDERPVAGGEEDGITETDAKALILVSLISVLRYIFLSQSNNACMISVRRRTEKGKKI